MRSTVPSAMLAAFLVAATPLVARQIASAATFSEEKPFSQTAFDAAKKAGKPILVHVTASWCTTCAAQKPILTKLLAEPRFKGLDVFNVDFDRQKALLRQLGVRMQSTMIVYKAAKEEGRSSGQTEPDAIQSLLEKAI